MLRKRSLSKFLSASLLVGVSISSCFAEEANYTIEPWSFVVPEIDNVNERSESETQTQRLIVKLKPAGIGIISANGSSGKGDKESFVDKKMKDFEGILGFPVTFVRVMGGGAWVIEMPVLHTKAMAINLSESLLELDTDLSYAHPDYVLHTQGTPNDPSYFRQWHLQSTTGGISLPDALDYTEGLGATVAVVDTGYLPHVDLVANVLPGFDFVTDLISAGDGDGRDADATNPGTFVTGELDSVWHGTHVAGTVAAVTNNDVGVAGVAPKAKILPVRVLGKAGSGSFADVADGIRWAAGGNVPGVPNNPNPANVINLSLGGYTPDATCEPEMASAIDFARNTQDAVVVVAAGNSSLDARFFTPANCDDVLTVAANDKLANLSTYSNRGNIIDVTAPGGLRMPIPVDPCEHICPRAEEKGALVKGDKGEIDFYQGYGVVLSTYNSGQTVAAADNYKGLTGTSMAAPHVAGVAALLFSLRPDFGASEVEQAIINTAREFPVDSNCDSAVCGAGLLDAKAAVEGSVVNTPDVSFNIGLSGSWYEPATSGQGLEIEIMPSANFIFAGWYSYSDSSDEPLGNNDIGQRWVTLSGNYINNTSSTQLTIYSNSGGSFDQPPITSAQAVGVATLSFDSCTSGRLDYSFTDTGVSGNIPLTRLSPDIYCQSITNGAPSPADISLNSSGINAGLTAAWYEPATSGQGFQIEVIPSANMLFIPWFTYSRTTNGGGGEAEQRWFTISGSYTSGSTNALNLPIYQNVGGQFDSPPVTSGNQVGTASLYFSSCTQATLIYSFADTGQSGSIPLTRLTSNSFCSN
jgi:serine protease